MRLVAIESPYAGKVTANIDYARCCMADSLRRGEAPYASHLIYTQPGILDDAVPEERELGISAGFVWADLAELRAIYVDRGISIGMGRGILRALETRQLVTFRSLERDEETVRREIDRWVATFPERRRDPLLAELTARAIV
jgi:hypothetical protein